VSVIYILLPLALLLAGVALLVFIWAARSGQFDDLETPAMRILHEDEEVSMAAGGDLPALPPGTGPSGEPASPLGRRAGRPAGDPGVTRSP
jgi:cbb3-type cytochrome oxidase maturation protein